MKRAWTLLERLLHPPKWVLLTLPPILFAALLIAVYMLLHSRKMKEVTSVDPLGE